MDYVGHRMAHHAALHEASRASPGGGLATPLNAILGLVLAYAVYTTAVAPRYGRGLGGLARPRPPTVFAVYTPRTLQRFCGAASGSAAEAAPVYLAVRGRVFDVTPGRAFYGPGGPYANFAGRDASRGLALGSFDADVLTAELDGPLDGLDDLGPDEMGALGGWEERFLEKYDVVGRLVSAAEYDEAAAGKAE